MAVTFVGNVRKIYFGRTGETTDKRQVVMVTQSITKLNSDATIAWDTGLSEVYYGNATGNIISKPFRESALSGGTITFDDGGSTSNTAAKLVAIGRE